MTAQLRVGLALLLLAARANNALSTEEWQEQSIYAVITDRFARSGPANASAACSYRNYCGGTWKGIEDHLDYIQGMGFTALWLSPIVKQLEPPTAYGCLHTPTTNETGACFHAVR